MVLWILFLLEHKPEIENFASIQVLLTHTITITIYNFKSFPEFSSGRFYRKWTAHIVEKTKPSDNSLTI